jgi:hypothetical protein
MSGWEQVAGSGESDPLTLATSGERQQRSFHGHVFDFECRLAPHHYPMIPNGVQLEMHIVETAGGDPTKPIECSAVAIQGGQDLQQPGHKGSWGYTRCRDPGRPQAGTAVRRTH